MGLNLGMITSGVKDALFGVAGKGGVRFGSHLLGMTPASTMDYLVEGGLAIVSAMILNKWTREGARAWLQGGLMAPIEGLIVANHVPYVSNYLGDYNTMSLNIPNKYNAIAPNPSRAVGMRPGMNGYPRPVAAMHGYVTAPAAPTRGFSDMGDWQQFAEGY